MRCVTRKRQHTCCWPPPYSCASPTQDKDKVGDLFNRAKEAGAQQGTTDDLEDKKGAFSGTSRTLDGGVRQVRVFAPPRPCTARLQG